MPFSQLNVPRIIPHGFTSHNELHFQVDRGCHFALYDPVADKTKNFKIKLDGRCHTPKPDLRKSRRVDLHEYHNQLNITQT